MKKTVLASFCVSMLLTGMASASPLTDYSAGKVSIDINYSKQGIDYRDDEDNVSFNKKGNWDFAGTFGLGNKFALQYAQANTGSTPTSVYVAYYDKYFTDSYKLHTQQFNVLYQLDKNFSVYTGIVKVDGTYTIHDNNKDWPSNTKNIWQFGVQGHTKLADKLTGFASLGIGKDLNTYNIGFGYEFAPNLEFNMMYDYKKVKKLADDAVPNYDIAVKGLKYGITYKF